MAHPIHNSLTWYDATVSDRPVFAPLGERVVADICVIGGGLAGLTTALELARGGRGVVLLEAGTLACSASGRNGGFVSNGFAQGFDSIAKTVGNEEARALHQFSAAGTEYVRTEIETHDPSIKMGDGAILMQRFRDKGSLQRYGEKLNREAGENLQFLDRTEIQALLRSEAYHCGLWSKTAFHIHPLRYALMMAGNARAAGARIFEHSEVTSVKRTNSGFDVATRHGSVISGVVVTCVSALDLSIHKPTGQALLPIATYIAVTSPIPEGIIQTHCALSDTRRAGNYFRLLPDRRLLWGGHITTSTTQPADLAKRMKRDIESVFPDLSQVSIEYSWAGLMGYAMHKMPLIGQSRPGEWHATGFGGHGLNTTAMAGCLVSNAILNNDDAHKRFQRFAPRRVFGALGRAGVQTAYWSMQIRDWLDEKRSS